MAPYDIVGHVHEFPQLVLADIFWLLPCRNVEAWMWSRSPAARQIATMRVWRWVSVGATSSELNNRHHIILFDAFDAMVRGGFAPPSRIGRLDICALNWEEFERFAEVIEWEPFLAQHVEHVCLRVTWRLPYEDTTMMEGVENMPRVLREILKAFERVPRTLMECQTLLASWRLEETLNFIPEFGRLTAIDFHRSTGEQMFLLGVDVSIFPSTLQRLRWQECTCHGEHPAIDLSHLSQLREFSFTYHCKHRELLRKFVLPPSIRVFRFHAHACPDAEINPLPPNIEEFTISLFYSGSVTHFWEHRLPKTLRTLDMVCDVGLPPTGYVFPPHLAKMIVNHRHLEQVREWIPQLVREVIVVGYHLDPASLGYDRKRRKRWPAHVTFRVLLPGDHGRHLEWHDE